MVDSLPFLARYPVRNALLAALLLVWDYPLVLLVVPVDFLALVPLCALAVLLERSLHSKTLQVVGSALLEDFKIKLGNRLVRCVLLDHLNQHWDSPRVLRVRLVSLLALVVSPHVPAALLVV